MSMIVDNTRAAWPNNWSKEQINKVTQAQNNHIINVFASISKYLHAQAASHVLPSLNFTAEDIQFMDDERSRQISLSNNSIQRIQFITSDNLKIDGAIIWNDPSEAVNENYTNKPWILYFNGNSESYEENLSYLTWYAKDSNCNVLCFNYRGVGDSEGFPYHAISLSLDGDAAFQFLLRHGIKSEQILIHARSLGGAVGTKVRSYHPDGPICNERSFFSWRSVEEGLPSQRKNNLYKNFLKSMEWEFDPIKDWEKIKGKKWIIVSKTDEVINYNTSSFAKKILNSTDHDSSIIEMPDTYSRLRGHAPDGHNIPLKNNELKETWEKHKQFLANALNKGE